MKILANAYPERVLADRPLKNKTGHPVWLIPVNQNMLYLLLSAAIAGFWLFFRAIRFFENI